MKIKNYFSLFMVMVFISINTPLNAFAGVMQQQENNVETYEVVDVNTSSSGVQVEFNITDKWNDGYNAEVTIKNDSEKAIENWTLQFEFDEEITNIWGASVKQHNDSTYLIKNDVWNGNILPNNTVSFGFSGTCGENVSAPEGYKLLTKRIESNEDNYSVNFQIMSDWGAGYTAQITITNVGNKGIEGWCIDFDFDKPINNVWNGIIEDSADNHYRIKNNGYNANINVGESITFGFSGNEGNIADEPQNYYLSETTDDGVSDNVEIVVDESSFALTETIDGVYVTNKPVQTLLGKLTNRGKVSDFYYQVLDRQKNVLETKKLDVAKKWSIDGFDVDTSKTMIKIVAVTEDNKTVEKTIVYFGELDAMDNDGDGLENCFEEYFKTDMELVDTDGDGLSDYLELNDFCTNPLKVDTDDNGTSDYDEDADSDEISNGREIEIGSNPLDNDSDNDGLTDDLELAFGTSPIVADTNSNDITDYEEYRLKQMQAEYDEATGKYTAVFSAEQMDINYDLAVVPTIELTADAKGLLSFEMAMVENSCMLNPSMAGYMGAAYDFTTDGSIDKAVLTFTYNEEYIDADMLNSDGFCPTIYYYNPDDDTFTSVEGQVWENNTVTVTLPHFSTYILVNKHDIDELWNRTINVDNNADKNINQIMFVMDKSGSMRKNDPDYIRTSLIRSFFEKMGKNDTIGLVGFSNDAHNYSYGLTNDKAVVENAIAQFENQKDEGSTYLNKGIELAATTLRNADNGENVSKSIFALTDGRTTDTISDSYLNALKADGIKVYTVGLGEVAYSYLKNIAKVTDGEYFYAKTSEDLSDVFIEFEEKINPTDKNGDGLNDELTRLICNGEITTITGTTLFAEDEYDAIMEKSDFDGDGLLNGEEIEIYYLNETPFVKVNSLPDDADSDGDEYDDYEEVSKFLTNPMAPNYIVNNADLMYVGNNSNFQSGIANDVYINKNIVSNVAKRFVDVWVNGGEYSTKMLAYKELASFLATYASENEDEMEYTASIELVKTMYGVCKDLKTLDEKTGKYVDMKELQDLVNDLYEKRETLKKLKFSKENKAYIHRLKNEIKTQSKTIAEIDEELKKFRKSGKIKFSGVDIFVELSQATTETYETYVESLKTAELAKRYKYILDELAVCGNEDVEYAAQLAERDFNKLFENNIKYVGGKHFLSILESAVLQKVGFAGMVVSFLTIASNVVLGDAPSIELSNSETVQLSLAIDMVASKYIMKGSLCRDINGDLCYNSYAKHDLIKALWGMDIYSKYNCEQKYIGYLENDRFLVMDDDFFLYHTKDSLKLAKSNRDKLMLLYQGYM